MTHKISVIKDVVRNEPHALAIATESGISVKAVTEFGKSLLERVQFSTGIDSVPKIISNNLPAGFEVTQFKEMSHSVSAIVEETFSKDLFQSENIKTAIDQKIDKKLYTGRKNLYQKNRSGFRAPSGRALNKFKTFTEKINIVDYKAKLFKSTTKRSEIVKTLERNEIRFNTASSSLEARASSGIESYMQTKALSHVGEASIRRFFREKNTEPGSTKNRISRRVKTLAAQASEKKTESRPEGAGKFITAIKAKFKRQ